MKYSVQIVGVGGQGVLLASMVLGNAAMRCGYEVTMSEVHGMAQRGGSVLSTVRFGDDVASPLESVGNANVILGFEPVETCRNVHLGNIDTRIIMNLDPIHTSLTAAGFESYPNTDDIINAISGKTKNLMTINATSLAEKAGKAVAANAVMIGAAACSGIPISRDVLRETLLDTVPEKFKELNGRAFDLGYDHMSSEGHK